MNDLFPFAGRRVSHCARQRLSPSRRPPLTLRWRRVHRREELSAGPGSRDERRAPKAGEAARQDRLDRAQTEDGGMAAGKARTVAAAPVPKRAKH